MQNVPLEHPQTVLPMIASPSSSATGWHVSVAYGCGQSLDEQIVFRIGSPDKQDCHGDSVDPSAVERYAAPVALGIGDRGRDSLHSQSLSARAVVAAAAVDGGARRRWPEISAFLVLVAGGSLRSHPGLLAPCRYFRCCSTHSRVHSLVCLQHTPTPFPRDHSWIHG